MDETYYLYAITRADFPPMDFGLGVDPRYRAELVRCGLVAAVTSRVGLDQFDLTKIQQGTADVARLSQIALRHHQIVQRLAERGPALPLRLAALFRGKSSLMEKLAQCETRAADFLQALGDRREWAVKVYLDRARAERALAGGAHPQEPRRSGTGTGGTGVGVRYLAGRREHLGRVAELHAVVRRELLSTEARLAGVCPDWRRLRPLSPELTGRPESMVWNGALLVPQAIERSLEAACADLGGDLRPKGLLLELTGPWPVYHFCPALDGPDCSAAAPVPFGVTLPSP